VSGANAPELRAADTITPFTGETRVLSEATVEERRGWHDTGLTVIAEGRVGVLLMAGGQGTRLGSNQPKGMYDIGLPSHKSLFQLMAERIQRLRTLAHAHRGDAASPPVSLPWYVLTSDATHDETVAYFEEHSYWGLPAEDVVIFQQGLNPCLDLEGKILLQTPCTVAMAPNGNGGLHAAVASSGALEHMRTRGVEHLHAFGVDNVLIKVADPYFLGYCASKGVQAANKVVLKEAPHEKVGVMCNRNGSPSVVEYSEISKEMAERRDEGGMLVYAGANIANHYFSTQFIADITGRAFLPQHVAMKAIPYCDSYGVMVTPTEPNGMKLEMFVFDVFALADEVCCLAVSRDAEFAAVKNKPGPGVQDSPDTARAAVSAYHASLVALAGGVVTDPEGGFEISPLVSYDGEGLGGIVANQIYTTPCELR
jgi:UDP-N-acetylglucosamine/UDP-N-acetylgalactosamine diphosphorylase